MSLMITMGEFENMEDTDMMQLPFSMELMNGKGEPLVMDFRAATTDDVDKVMELQETIMNALPDKDLYSPYTREETMHELENYPCYVAECGGELAGYSVLIPNDPDDPESPALLRAPEGKDNRRLPGRPAPGPQTVVR